MEAKSRRNQFCFWTMVLLSALFFVGTLTLSPPESLAGRDAEGWEREDYWQVRIVGPDETQIEIVQFGQGNVHNVTLGVQSLIDAPLVSKADRSDQIAPGGWEDQFTVAAGHSIVGLFYEKNKDTAKFIGGEEIEFNTGENDRVIFFIQKDTGGPLGKYEALVNVTYFCKSGQMGCTKDSTDIVAIQTAGIDTSNFDVFTEPQDLDADDQITDTDVIEKIKLYRNTAIKSKAYFITDEAIKSAGSPVVEHDDVSAIGSPVDFDITEGGVGADADQALYMAIDLNATDQSLIRKYTFDENDLLDVVSTDIYTTDVDTTIAALALNRNPNAVGDPGVLLLVLKIIDPIAPANSRIEIRVLDLETLVLGEEVLYTINDPTAEIHSLDTYFGSTPLYLRYTEGGVPTFVDIDPEGVEFVQTGDLTSFTVYGAQAFHAPELPAGMVPVFMTALSGMMFWLRSRFHR